MRYTFQPSKIWEGGPPQPDHRQEPKTIKVQKTGIKGERAARSLLPKLSVGREWILTRIDGISIKEIERR